MLKHKDILDKLNKLQKVAIIASALDTDAFERAGIPPVNVAPLDEINGDSTLSYGSAARSWDPELVGGMTKQLIETKGCKNNLFVTPDLKTTVNPSEEGLSEDACLNGAIGQEIIRAAHSVGAAVGVASPSVSGDEIAYVDVAEDYAAVQELFVNPFLRAVDKQPCDAVILDPSREGTGYYDTNRSLLCEVQNGLLGDDVFIVCKGETFTADAVGLLRGKITLGGCTIPLERAVRRYAQLKAYEEEGSIPRREIEDSIANGSAIDDDMLDELVDNIVDFALTLDDPHVPEASDDEKIAHVAPESADNALSAEDASEHQDADADFEQANGAQEQRDTNFVQSEATSDKQVTDTVSEKDEPASGDNAQEGEESIKEDIDTSEAQSTTENEVESAKSASLNEDSDIDKKEIETEQSVLDSESFVQGGSEIERYATGETNIDDNAVGLSVETERRTSSDVPTAAFDEPIDKRIVSESFVLLKNRGLLPLRAGAKIAVLGEAYRNVKAIGDKFKVVGVSKGYDRTAQRSDPLIPAAVRATKYADAVLVFLYADGSGKLALPANRLALLDALRKAGKRVIAVVCDDRPIDLSFDNSVDALFIAPADVPYASEALAEILCGEKNPSGRLTRTYYDNADEYYRRYRADRDAGVMHIGSFVGYRRYGIENTKVRYPFGYGLSYTEFTYSDLSVSMGQASFTIKNSGNYDGCEVAQLYIGVPDVSHVAPKRQLRAFRKVYLEKGESKNIVIPLAPRDFETFDKNMYADNVEAGIYTIYVGKSSQDVRLRGRLALGGVTREKEKKSVADYSSDGDYGDASTLSKDHRVSKKGKDVPDNLNILHKVAQYAMPIFAVLFFVLLSIFIVSYSIDYLMLSAFEQGVVEQFMFLAALVVFALLPLAGSLSRRRLMRMRNVALALTPFMILVCVLLYSIMRSGINGKAESVALNILTYIALGTPILAIVAMCIERQLWRDKMGKNHWDKYYFEREESDKITSDEQFDLAMRAATAAREAKAVSKKQVKPTVAAEVPIFYDNRLTYSQLLGDCKQFVAESGVTVSEETLGGYIAALFSTRLLFVPAGSGAELCETVSEYFGRKAYVDNAEKYARFEDMFSEWRPGGYVNAPTNLSVAIDKAAKETAYLHTVLIRHVDKKMIETLFAPIADVLSRKKMTFAVGEKSLTLPANVMIVAEIEADKIVLPEIVAEVSAVLSPVCGRCEKAQRRTIVQTVGFERISAMGQTVRDDHPLDEEHWKSVDALDARFASGHIGNNIWNRMEMHSSVIVACGGSQDEAMDSAIAVELLPWLSIVWDESTSESGLADSLADIFGREMLGQSMAMLNASDGVEQ